MKNKIFNIICILFGLMFINAGMNKFFNYIPVPDGLPEALIKDSMAMMEIQWLMPLIACAEILGGVLVLFPRTRPLGALIVFPVLVGVLLTHIYVAPDGLIQAILFWAVLIWIIWEYRRKYLVLIGK